jgi:phospholipase/lecithinase/hemolysin
MVAIAAGFEDDILTICCGGPGTALCGDQGAITCEDPSARLFWDVVHMTEVAYRYIAEDWLRIIESPGNKII